MLLAIFEVGTYAEPGKLMCSQHALVVLPISMAGQAAKIQEALSQHSQLGLTRCMAHSQPTFVINPHCSQPTFVVGTYAEHSNFTNAQHSQLGSRPSMAKLAGTFAWVGPHSRDRPSPMYGTCAVRPTHSQPTCVVGTYAERNKPEANYRQTILSLRWRSLLYFPSSCERT